MQFRRFLLPALVAAAALVHATGAAAYGGNYTFDGGTAQERAQVRSALDVSRFNWSVVPATITIHIVPGLPSSEAAPGEIWLSADLLRSGTFSWGVVQHEYAHQVDFFLFDDATRARLNTALGGRAWCWGTPGFEHRDYGCERFASTLAWSYWPSPLNCMRPDGPHDESAAMKPAQFRALVNGLVGHTDAGGPRARMVESVLSLGTRIFEPRLVAHR